MFARMGGTHSHAQTSRVPSDGGVTDGGNKEAPVQQARRFSHGPLFAPENHRDDGAGGHGHVQLRGVEAEVFLKTDPQGVSLRRLHDPK